MPLFDVEFNRRIGHGAIDKGRAVVEADNKDSAKEAVLDRFGLSASGTMTRIDLIEDDVLLLSRKQLAEPSNPIISELPPLTKAERKQREIEKAYRQLQQQNKTPDKKPESLKKFLCAGRAIVQALDEEHALRMFAEEMMARAQGRNKVTQLISEVSINVSSVLDQRSKGFVNGHR